MQALEPLENDRFNQDYTYNEITLILQASHIQLTDTEENKLQRILAKSFDTSHPDFDQHKAIENLKANFNGTVALCSECLMAKHRTELEQYKDQCKECYEELHPSVEIYKPLQIEISIPPPQLESQLLLISSALIETNSEK